MRIVRKLLWGIDPGHALRFFLLTQCFLATILSALMESGMEAEPSLEKDSLIRNPDVILREEDPDGALLFNPDTNQIRVINGTGLFIWRHCDGKKDLPAIVAAMNETFGDIPESEIETQVIDFLDDLKANGFIGKIIADK